MERHRHKRLKIDTMEHAVTEDVPNPVQDEKEPDAQSKASVTPKACFSSLPVEIREMIWMEAAKTLPAVPLSHFDIDFVASKEEDGEDNVVLNACFTPCKDLITRTKDHRALLTVESLARHCTVKALGGQLLPINYIENRESYHPASNVEALVKRGYVPYDHEKSFFCINGVPRNVGHLLPKKYYMRPGDTTTSEIMGCLQGLEDLQPLIKNIGFSFPAKARFLYGWGSMGWGPFMDTYIDIMYKFPALKRFGVMHHHGDGEAMPRRMPVCTLARPVSDLSHQTLYNLLWEWHMYKITAGDNPETVEESRLAPQYWSGELDAPVDRNDGSPTVDRSSLAAFSFAQQSSTDESSHDAPLSPFSSSITSQVSTTEIRTEGRKQSRGVSDHDEEDE